MPVHKQGSAQTMSQIKQQLCILNDFIHPQTDLNSFTTKLNKKSLSIYSKEIYYYFYYIKI